MTSKLKQIWQNFMYYVIMAGMIIVGLLFVALIILATLAKCGIRFNIHI